MPAQVNYVGLGADLKKRLCFSWFFPCDHPLFTDGLSVGQGACAGRRLRAFVRYTRNAGTLAFVSYRDPNVERTLAVYKDTANYLGNLTLSREELTKAIVGAIGDIDTYLLPSAKGNAALWEYMTGYTKAMREQVRAEVLDTTPADFHDFAPYLQKALDGGVETALGGGQVQEYAAKANWNIIKLL